jgi:hypothetical protein
MTRRSRSCVAGAAKVRGFGLPGRSRDAAIRILRKRAEPRCRRRSRARPRVFHQARDECSSGDRTEECPPVRNTDGTTTFQRDPNDESYKVGGIPQIHLIDRKGCIRLIMVGYDDANEPKIAEMIERLLAEK